MYPNNILPPLNYQRVIGVTTILHWRKKQNYDKVSKLTASPLEIHLKL
jgi:hypothetical protein